ncbi:hypothetical protein J2X13_002081 [Aminobacter aminovorans]|nr:hypothetical protein [Aminobacter aminovorans]
MKSSSHVPAFDFDIALGALRRMTPLPADLSEARALARELLADLCPEKTYPDEVIEAMVHAVATEPAAITRYAAE